MNEPKHGFWGGLARKAKAILDDDNDAQQSETPGRTRPQMPNTDTRSQVRIIFQDCIYKTITMIVQESGENHY